MRRVGSVIVAIGLALSPIAGHAADAHGHDKRGANGGDNLLKGSGKFEPKEDMKVLVSLTLAGKAAQQARFTPFHKEGANQKGHKH